MSTVSTTRAPKASTRIHDVDALRGFALLGILMVNITFIASAYPANLVEDPAFTSPLDDAARFVVAALFSMKFYLLFSFLFGYSFVLQMDSARRAGRSFAPRMLRRLLGLLLLGAGVMVFYSGDILTVYAVVGTILLAMHRVDDRVALRTAGAIFAVVVLSMVVSAAFVDSSALMPSGQEALANAAEETESMRGDVGDVVRRSLGGLELYAIQTLTLQGPMALVMFLLGMVAARRQALSGFDGGERLLRRAQWIGFPVGLVGGVAYASLGGAGSTVGAAISVPTAPFLTVAYAATLIRLAHAPATARLRDMLAPAGRMALTNYLAQAVVATLLFTGIGFGLAGQVSPVGLVVLAVAIFSAQAAVSAWWLRRHRYGPAEYLLRWFTNWQRPTGGLTGPASPPGQEPRAKGVTPRR